MGLVRPWVPKADGSAGLSRSQALESSLRKFQEKHSNPGDPYAQGPHSYSHYCCPSNTTLSTQPQLRFPQSVQQIFKSKEHLQGTSYKDYSYTLLGSKRTETGYDGPG